jgi:hypothetical protein
MASDWALQYLPEVVIHVQTGCAHFVAFVAAIVFFLRHRIKTIRRNWPSISSGVS